jgi:hypothetical protein
MQMIVLLCSVWFAERAFKAEDKIEYHVKNLLWSLAFEHVFAYASDYFR